MVGRGLGPRCSSYVSCSHLFIFGLILAVFSSRVRASAVNCKSTDISLKYQHCGIHPDGVHGLDCFGKYNSPGIKTCVWKPGGHTSDKTYTLIIQQPSKKYCKAHVNVTDVSAKVRLYEKHNLTAEVYENSESTKCTKAVFSGSPTSLLRCGPPYNVSFSRRSGKLAVTVNWQQVDIKAVKFYSVRYKALGSPTWSEPVGSQNGESCTVEDLTSSLVYSVQIQCVTNEKCSQCVWSEDFTVPSELKTQPVVVNVQDSNVAERKGIRLLTLTWKFSAEELIDGYRVTVGKASGEAPCQRMDTTHPEITLILSHSAYRVNISAVNNASVSPAESRRIPRREDEPSAGAGKLNVTVHNNTSFTIYWEDDLIKTYVCYSAEWRKTGRKAAFMSFHQNENNYRTLSPLPDNPLAYFKHPEPLEPYKRYSITLHTRPDKDTCNLKRVNNSESTYGSTQFYLIEGSPVSAPTNISSGNVTLNSVVLRWSSIPEDDVGGFLLGYTIHYAEYQHQGASTERNITVDPDLNSYKLRDLKSGTAYKVQISGFTRAGAGLRSPASLFETNHQGYSKLRGVITVFAVMAAVLIFGSQIIKRAKVLLWPSIPNPGNSNAMQKMEGPCELKLLESIDTLKVEEWDTNSLQIVEKEDVFPAITSPSMLLLLRASEDERDSAETIQRDVEDAAGDISPDSTAETISDIQCTNLQTSPLTFPSGYTTMDMFQQAMPRGGPANTSVTQESEQEDTELTVVKSGLDYMRQFSTSPTLDDEDFARTVWNRPAEHEEPGTQDQNNYCP